MLPPLWRLPIPHPSLFFATAVVLTGLLGVSIYGENQRAADRVLALREGPPAAVPIESFDATRQTGPTGEVMILAQIDMSLPMQVVYGDGRLLSRALAYPVVSTTAQPGDSAPPVLGFFHVATDLPEAEILDFAYIVPDFEKVGAFGPIVALNGELGAPVDVVERVSSLLAQAGRPATQPLLRIAAYPEGRAAALVAPRRAPLRDVWMALALAFVGMGVAMGRLYPVLIERQRLARFASIARKRSGVAPEIATPKARSRLAPLAEQPDTTPKVQGPLNTSWQRLLAIRSPR